ncbi:hypothetical protein [Geosporobacter ferrireducens]|uniref:Uncharacterized protein n=1 Tax=Geosporobacter ferrireducens TaxID=1424294 RepID=A0A1D8GDT4_9FIRM|nr:hypothetical protein [Geosporobacter ferrireducens]AOT69061.1 hypothetical protein Gferi_05500 [Geosporobacter ferrireducens]MTI56731.1 DUF4175 domain-containing protein [Geosporobacter ferrireducens]
MVVILVMLLYLIIGFYEIFPLARDGEHRKIWLYGALFLGAFVISLLLSLNIKPPSPAKPIQQLVEVFVKK